MKDKMMFVCFVIVLVLFFGGLIWFETLRWETFQDITNSEIGYFEWKLLIDNRGR